jgi:hypothetical protein
LTFWHASDYVAASSNNEGDAVLRRVTLATSGLIALSGVIAATVTGQAPTPTITITVGPQSVSVAGADNLPAGPTRVEIRTAARRTELEGVLIALRPGRTVEDVRRALPSAQDSPVPIKRLATFEAGGTPTRTRSYVTTIDLRAGVTYAAANVGQNIRNTRLSTFTVGSAEGGSARPAPAATVAIHDYAFGMPATLPRSGTVRFENRGDRLHFAAAFPLRKGASRVAAVRALMRNQEDRLARLVDFGGGTGLVGAVSPGTVNDVEVRFNRPGNWLLACFIQDGERGNPSHNTLGMAKAFTVR